MQGCLGSEQSAASLRALDALPPARLPATAGRERAHSGAAPGLPATASTPNSGPYASLFLPRLSYSLSLPGDLDNWMPGRGLRVVAGKLSQ